MPLNTDGGASLFIKPRQKVDNGFGTRNDVSYHFCPRSSNPNFGPAHFRNFFGGELGMGACGDRSQRPGSHASGDRNPLCSGRSMSTVGEK